MHSLDLCSSLPILQQCHAASTEIKGSQFLSFMYLLLLETTYTTTAEEAVTHNHTVMELLLLRFIAAHGPSHADA